MPRTIQLPAGFMEKYQNLLSKSEAKKFFEYCQKPLRKSIRVNTLKISVSKFKILAKSKKWHLIPIPWCKEGFWLERTDISIPLGKTIEHTIGLFFIQEASSMLPVEMLLFDNQTTQNNIKILDLCAAPGAKTTQLAAKMNNQGILAVNELSASRMKKLTFNLGRMGVTNTVLFQKQGEEFGQQFSEGFDLILVDAPCTGEGTIRKDHEALQGWSPRKIANAAHMQKKIIQSAFRALSKGGSLVYSTCTMAPEENESIIQWLISQEPSAQLLDLTNSFPEAENIDSSILPGTLRMWPHIFDSEGFFVAKIIKSPDDRPQEKQKKSKMKTGKINQKDNKLQKINRKNLQKFEPYFDNIFNFPISSWQNNLYTQKITTENDHHTKTKLKIFFLPDNFDYFLNYKFDRAGVMIGELYENDFRLSHECAVMLGSQFKKSKQLNINKIQACDFFAGKDLVISEINNEIKPQGQMVMIYNNTPLGLVKIINNKLKNLLPRNYIINLLK